MKVYYNKLKQRFANFCAFCQLHQIRANGKAYIPKKIIPWNLNGNQCWVQTAYHLIARKEVGIKSYEKKKARSSAWMLWHEESVLRQKPEKNTRTFWSFLHLLLLRASSFKNKNKNNSQLQFGRVSRWQKGCPNIVSVRWSDQWSNFVWTIDSLTGWQNNLMVRQAAMDSFACLENNNVTELNEHL